MFLAMRGLVTPGLAVLLTCAPAAAQGLLPASGVDVRAGNLRSQLERAYAAGPPITEPGWTVTPSVDLEGVWSDPVQGVGGNLGPKSGADFYTILTPAVSVFGNSQRLQGGLFLAPELRGYARYGKLNSFNPNFSGQAHAVLVPDAVFVDVAGSSAMQSRSGGLASSSSLNRSDSVQTTTYMISPTAQHQFGDYGTARIGATLSQSMNDAQSSIASNSPFVEPISSTPLTTKEARASFRTGEFLGQTAAELHTLISQKNGGGALRNSSRNSTALDVERYLDRQWTLLTSIGVEDIRYSGLTPRRFNNVTWSGGARWIPNADSSITVSYGRHDAGTSLMVDANYAATSRIRLSVNYSEGISSGQEDAQNALSSASINSAGQLINRQTGLPIYTNSAYFGTQTNSAYRYKRAFGSATLLLDRTVFTVSLRKDDQTLLSAATTAAPGAISGTFGTLAMQRELSPAINASVFIEVGQRQTPGLQAAVGRRSSSQDSLSLGGMLSVALSETLAARMQYSFTNLSSPTPGLSQTQNLVLLGLHKNF